MVNAFDDDRGRFLQSEKDTRPHWETERRGMFWPVMRNGYNNARDWAMPEALGGHGAKVMSDIVQGNPLTQEEINHGAQGAANFMLTGGLAGNIGKRPQAGVASMFGGTSSKTADMGAHNRANTMDAAGTPREQIWNDTGWFKGVDGKWRSEIDDSNATLLSGDGSGPLSSHYMHNDLFKAYPDTGAINLHRYTGDKNAGGTYQGPVPAGYGGPAVRESISINRANDQNPTIKHELQHALQEREGFARGGRSSEPNYDALAGEVEARAVQSRMDLTADERRARPPWLDYDVPEAQQIVRFGSDGPQMSSSGAQPPKVNALSDVLGRDVPRQPYTGGAPMSNAPIHGLPKQAALRVGDETYTGREHYLAIGQAEAEHGTKKLWSDWDNEIGWKTNQEGFVTASGDFLSRSDAARRLQEAGLRGFTGGDALHSTTLLDLQHKYPDLFKTTSGPIFSNPKQGATAPLAENAAKNLSSGAQPPKFPLIPEGTFPSQTGLQSAMRQQGLRSHPSYEADVPLGSIRPLQPPSDMDPAKVAGLVGNFPPRDVNVSPELGVSLYRHGDQYYTMDGHHRAEAARQRGDATLPALVRDIYSNPKQGATAPLAENAAKNLSSGAQPPTVVPFTPRLKPLAAPARGVEKAVLPYSPLQQEAANAFTKMANPLTPEQAAKAGTPPAVDPKKAFEDVWAKYGLAIMQRGMPNDPAEYHSIARLMKEATDGAKRKGDTTANVWIEPGKDVKRFDIDTMLDDDWLGGHSGGDMGIGKSADPVAIRNMLRSEGFIFSNPKQGAIAPLAENAAKNLNRDVDGLGYYSAALEAAKAWPQSKGTPEQALAWLTKNGTKQAEIDATGVGNAFSGPVSRDDLVKYLGENRVGVKETGYGRIVDTYTAEQAARDAGYRSVDEAAEVLNISPETFRARHEESSMSDGTKWSRHSLDPSNPTYRETVLSLPRNEEKIRAERAPVQSEFIALNERYSGRGEPLSADEMARMEALRSSLESYSMRMKDARSGDFQSGHFPEPNIVGHMMSSLNKHEGKNVYTLDQIQSDWGQKLRDGGVRDEAKIAELKAAIAKTGVNPMRRARGESAVVADLNAAESQLARETASGTAWPSTTSKIAQLRAELADISNRPGDYNDKAITAQRLLAELRTAEASASGHPLVNTTDQWTNTTLRRGLQQAIDAEAEYMAIPSGKTVLGYNPGDTHGMETFYNQIVPKNLGNILSKLDKAGGGKQFVQQLETPSGMKGDGFSVFQITPAMREQARKGLPLFMNPVTGAIVPLTGNAFDDHR